MLMQLRALVDAGTLTRQEAEAMAQGSLTPPRMKPWPTPTVCGNYNRAGLTAKSGDGLATAVTKCATPTARDWRSGKASEETHARNSRPLSEQIGGSLNPTWVEWLMGWPLGWTDLKPSATAKSPSAPQPPGGC
jgi:DNA (cytosine-5)-methyltransferase 1